MPVQTERGGGGIALTHSQLWPTGRSVVSTTPWPLYSRKGTGTHCTCGWVASEPVWTGAENFTSTGILSLDRQSRWKISRSGRRCTGVCTYSLVTCLVLSDCTSLSMCSWQRLHDYSGQRVCFRSSQSAIGILAASLPGKDLVKPVWGRRQVGHMMWLLDAQWLGRESLEGCCYLSHIISSVVRGLERLHARVKVSAYFSSWLNSHKIYVLINLSRSMIVIFAMRLGSSNVVLLKAP
jgi:hypothetical protein